MAFTLDPKQSIRRGLKHAARQQLKRAEQHLRQDRGGDVHEPRKSVKKVRAVLALLEQADAGSLARDERRLREVGRTLSTLRDADAMIATFDQLRAHFPKRLPQRANAILRRHLVSEKTRAVKEAHADHRLARAADTLCAVRRSIERWKVPAIDAPDVPSLLKAGYREGRKAMRRAQKAMSPSELHRWRKRVKTFWYQLRVTASLAPDIRGEIRQLKQLERWLGEDHNLSLLQTAISGDRDLTQQVPTAVREVVTTSANLQVSLRRKAFALAERLLTERPSGFVRDLRQRVSPSPHQAVVSKGRSASAVAE